jgi:hypothetical protein
MTQKYTTHLSKGQGMISETMTLLGAWKPGMSVPQLKERVFREGILSKATALRLSWVFVGQWHSLIS